MQNFLNKAGKYAFIELWMKIQTRQEKYYDSQFFPLKPHAQVEFLKKINENRSINKKRRKILRLYHISKTNNY